MATATASECSTFDRKEGVLPGGGVLMFMLIIMFMFFVFVVE